MKKWAVSLVVAAICTVTAQNATAQSDLGFKAIGAQVGMVSPEDLDATFGFGVFADHGTITPDIRLESHIEYWGWSEDFNGGSTSVRDISVGARGKYMFETTSPSIRPFVGAGLGIHFLRAEVDIPEQDLGGGFIIPAMSASDSETRLGLDLGGGMEMPVNPNANFIAEAWYGIVSDASTLSLRVGLSWNLNQP